MSLSDIIALRLQAHWLVWQWFKTPSEVVKHFWCLQAQDIPQATWVIWSRISWSTKQTIKQALTDWSIVRTRPMRGTLHYMNPEHVHWMLDLCASKTLSGFAKRREFLGITDKHAEKALAIIEKSLKWGRSLTRTELGEVLKKWGIPMQTQRVYHLACYAATKWLICFGPPTEKEETFVLLDDRVKKPKKSLSHDEQLAELARMYIRWHGPSTVDDLARWCGLGKTICKKAIDSISDELKIIEYNSKIYYYMATLKKPNKFEVIQLLWWFDEYFLWYKDRSIVADTKHHGKLFTINGIFFPLILKNWEIVWSWKREWKKDSVVFNLSPLPWVKISTKDLSDKATIYATFWWFEKIVLQ